MMIPITNVALQNRDLSAELNEAFNDVLRSGQYIRGEYLQRFEMQFARFHGRRYGIGVNSGTDALAIALRAYGIGPGDEVITTAMSYLATAEAIAMVGATPVYVDILGDGTDCIDHKLLREALTTSTKAIIPVHLHGYACNMNAIMRFAESYKLIVIEDCAQATGLFIGNKRAGAIGHAGAFSFFPTKNLGALGDGGMILTDDEKVYQAAKVIRDHGCQVRNVPTIVGMNSRLDGLQAALLSVKLTMLDEWNGQRQAIAERYTEMLAAKMDEYPKLVTEVTLPPKAIEQVGIVNHDDRDYTCVYHHYAIRVPGAHRQELIRRLAEDGIEAHSYYPVPLTEMVYTKGAGTHCPNAEKQARTGLALPMYPELTSLEMEHIVDSFCRHLDELI